MKLNKLYLRIQFNNGNHQMLRADKFEGFRNIIFSEGYKQYQRLVSHKVDLFLKGNPKPGEKLKIEPYAITVSEDDFVKMQTEVNQKLGSWKKGEFKTFGLCFNSRSQPVIQINRAPKEKKAIEKEEVEV